MSADSFCEELIIAGFGGQGVILLGKLFASTAMQRGLEITYMPAYGAEVRGGAASCMLVVSDEAVACPAVVHPDSLITMNESSFERFMPNVKPGGLVVLNSSMISMSVDRDDLQVLPVPADKLAAEIGNPRSANMVMLGAYLGHKGVLSVDDVVACMPSILAKRYHHTLEANEKALRCGMSFAADLVAQQ